LEELKIEPVDEKLRRYKTNWLQRAIKINRRMPKNNVHVWTKWSRLGRKIFEETAKRGRNRSIKP
jgi:hypothetical protein